MFDMFNKHPHRGVLVAALALCAIAPASAQVDPLSTTAGFKAACERAGNTITINNSLTINQGYPAGYPERVATGCTVNLAFGATLQLDKVGLAFAGPLRIVGTTKTGLAMQEATLAGSLVELRFSGEETMLNTNLSRIDATAGDLTLTLPIKAKIEMLQSRTDGVPLTRATLAATGAVNITAGSELSASMVETGIVAGGNITMQTRSFGSELKFENSGMHSFGGRVDLLMGGSKAKFEFSNAGLRAPMGAVSIVTASTESNIGLSNVTLQAGTNLSVDAQGTLSNVLVSNGSMQAGGSLYVGTRYNGGVTIDNGAYRAATPIQFASGRDGRTGVYGATITGTGHVEVLAGPNGACEALGLRVTAVTQRLCQ